jgi:hypothetical protein
MENRPHEEPSAENAEVTENYSTRSIRGGVDIPENRPYEEPSADNAEGHGTSDVTKNIRRGRRKLREHTSRQASAERAGGHETGPQETIRRGRGGRGDGLHEKHPRRSRKVTESTSRRTSAENAEGHEQSRHQIIRTAQELTQNAPHGSRHGVREMASRTDELGSPRAESQREDSAGKPRTRSDSRDRTVHCARDDLGC